jgi:hypothetical protein
MISVESIANAIFGNEGYNVYARSPDSNLRVVALESGQFERVDFDNAGEMEIQCQTG